MKSPFWLSVFAHLHPSVTLFIFSCICILSVTYYTFNLRGSKNLHSLKKVAAISKFKYIYTKMAEILCPPLAETCSLKLNFKNRYALQWFGVVLYLFYDHEQCVLSPETSIVRKQLSLTIPLFGRNVLA